MPCSCARLHMMSEATEPPRWVCSSASPCSNIPPMVDRRGVASPLDYDQGRWAPSETPGPAAAAVLRRPPRARRRGGRRVRAAADRSRPRQSRHRAAGARRRGTRGGSAGFVGTRLFADPRPRPDEGGDRRPLPRRLRRRARPGTEVALVPGTKTAIVELAIALADEGETILLPDPYYPDYPSGLALAGARLQTVPLVPEAGWAPELESAPAAAALLLNYPSNPVRCALRPARSRPQSAGRGEPVGTSCTTRPTPTVFDGRSPEKLSL